jgi:predicted ATPase
LNGICVELGNFDDVRNSIVSRNEPIELMFRFERDVDHIDLHYFFIENDEDEMVANIEKLVGKGRMDDREFDFLVEKENGSSYVMHYGEDDYEHDWYNLLLPDVSEGDDLYLIQKNVEFTRIHYISADRIGPKDYYAKQSFAEFPNVGRRGEYTANLLSKKKNDLVDENLCLDSGETHTVLDQTTAWLSKIFEGGKIDIKPLEANIVLMELNSEDSVNLYKPVNVGFGYSYALPIIVSGLIAREGEILIVENPEAHLHPYAQSQIARFLAMVSTCGIQVFIESHSDHILNSLRVAVLDEIIPAERLNILYFQRDIDHQVIKIPVGNDGSIENWPDGFFDQTDRDFKRLFGF